MTDSATHDETLETTGRDVPASLDNDAWLRALIRDHAPVMRRIAASQVGPDSADDVVSESFATAWCDRASFDPTIASERAWLVGIVVNRCRSMGRAQRRWQHRAHRAIADVPIEFDDESAARIDAGRLGAEILRALRALPDDQRLVVLLVAHAQLTPTEIATALSMPPATVRSHLLRARRTIGERLQLDQQGDEDA
jgi:RNA polymerase sigma-70 factor (ECF subfamily)